MRVFDVFYCQTSQDDLFLAIWNGKKLLGYDGKGECRIGVEVLDRATIVQNFSPHHEYLFLNWKSNIPNGKFYINRLDVLSQITEMVK